MKLKKKYVKTLENNGLSTKAPESFFFYFLQISILNFFLILFYFGFFTGKRQLENIWKKHVKG